MRTQRPTSCSPAGPALLSLALLAAGCLPGEKRQDERDPGGLRDRLERLWDSHGGIEAWQRHNRVRMRVSVEANSPLLGLPEQDISFRLADWTLLAIGSGDHVGVIDLRATASVTTPEGLADYHLRASRLFFQLPLAFSRPGWEIHQDLAAKSGLPAPAGFWAVPIGFPTPHTGYYVVPDPETGLVKSVYYRVRESPLAGAVMVAEFRGYRRIDGVVIATEIVHSPIVSSPQRSPGAWRREKFKPRDPFEAVQATFDPTRGESPGAPSSLPSRWVLRYKDITFE